MILKNVRFLITQNSEREILENKDVLIKGSEIKEIGEDLPKEGKVLNCSEKVVMPGLINTHTHIGMNLFRGISDNKKLQDWLEEDIFPAEAKLESEDVYYGSLLALIEMLKTGTTCLNDMYFFEKQVAKACQESGIRSVLSRAVMDIDGDGEKRLKESGEFLKKYKEDELVTPAVGPHSIYTCSEEYLKKVREHAEEYDAPIHIHISETEKENKDCQDKHNKSPTEYLKELGFLGERTIGAHGVWISENDLEILKKTGTSLAHCPCSNMKLGSGKAPVPKMKQINVGLGTDGAASNNNLNLFDEAKFASLIQKIDDSTAMTGQKVLDMITIKGSEALGLRNKIGSIEEGKKADLITIDLKKSSIVPRYGKKGLISNLIFSFNGNVTDTIINGNLVLRDGEILNTNSKKIKEEVQRRTQKFSG